MAESFGAKKKRRVLLQGSDDRENKETQLASRRRKFLRANRPTDRSTYRPTDRPTDRAKQQNVPRREGPGDEHAAVRAGGHGVAVGRPANAVDGQLVARERVEVPRRVVRRLPVHEPDARLSIGAAAHDEVPVARVEV